MGFREAILKEAKNLNHDFVSPLGVSSDVVIQLMHKAHKVMRVKHSRKTPMQDVAEKVVWPELVQAYGGQIVPRPRTYKENPPEAGEGKKPTMIKEPIPYDNGANADADDEEPISRTKTSYVEMLRQRTTKVGTGDKSSSGQYFEYGVANVFVCYDRTTTVETVVNAITSYQMKNPGLRMFFWIDILCCRAGPWQWFNRCDTYTQFVGLPEAMYRRIRDIGRMLVVPRTATSADFLVDGCCVWQLFCAQTCRSSVVSGNFTLRSPASSGQAKSPLPSTLSFSNTRACRRISLKGKAANQEELVEKQPFVLDVYADDAGVDHLQRIIARDWAVFEQLNQYLDVRWSRVTWATRSDKEQFDETIDDHLDTCTYLLDRKVLEAVTGWILRENLRYVLYADVLGKTVAPSQQTANLYTTQSNVIGIILLLQRRPEFAALVLERCTRVSTLAYGEGHMFTQVFTDHLARAYSSAGQRENSINTFRRSMKHNSSFPFGGVTESSTQQMHLARELLANGQVEAALQLAYLVEEERRRELPENDRLVGIAYGDLGDLFLVQGHYHGAHRMYYKEASILAEARSTVAFRARTEFKLAKTYFLTARLDFAREHFEKALKMCEKALSPGHSDTASALHGLGTVQCILSNFRDGQLHLERAFSIRMMVFGKRHLLTANTAHSVAKVHLLAYQSGSMNHHYDFHLRKAKEMFELALAARTDILGSAHVATAKTLIGLAQAETELEEFDAAQEHLQDALFCFQGRVPRRHLIYVRQAYSALAALYQKRGDLETAQTYWSQSSWLKSEMYPANMPKSSTNKAEFRLRMAHPGKCSIDALGAIPFGTAIGGPDDLDDSVVVLFETGIPHMFSGIAGVFGMAEAELDGSDEFFF